MSDKIKKGLDFLKTGQGFLLFMLAPFFLRVRQIIEFYN